METTLFNLLELPLSKRPRRYRTKNHCLDLKRQLWESDWHIYRTPGTRATLWCKISLRVCSAAGIGEYLDVEMRQSIPRGCVSCASGLLGHNYNPIKYRDRSGERDPSTRRKNRSKTRGYRRRRSLCWKHQTGRRRQHAHFRAMASPLCLVRIFFGSLIRDKYFSGSTKCIKLKLVWDTTLLRYKNFKCDAYNKFEVNLYPESPINKHH